MNNDNRKIGQTWNPITDEMTVILKTLSNEDKCPECAKYHICSTVDDDVETPYDPKGCFEAKSCENCGNWTIDHRHEIARGKHICKIFSEGVNITDAMHVCNNWQPKEEDDG